MNYQKLAFDMCRCYVLDRKGLIPEEIFNKTIGWLRSRDLESLCSITDVFPHAYYSEDTCRLTRQVAAFFKKNAAFAEPEKCYDAAHTSFEKAEQLCRITNRRLDHYYSHQDRLDPELQRCIVRAENIIRDILGPFSNFAAELPRLIRITSGATATLSRRNASRHLKMRVRNVSASKRCIPLLRQVYSEFGFDKVSFKECNANRVETVLKNWKTDRTIACEAEGNLTLQLAFDMYVKERLLKFGVDLSNQEVNQLLAKIGSMSGKLATLDLKMASDTAAHNAVGWLIPGNWFLYLNSIRSPQGVGFGQVYNYAKFSSMGNGATFALESLIFFALAKAVSDQKGDIVSIYGDDIIVEGHNVVPLERLLKFFGFYLNTEKSYREGPFRESCGADWYEGRNVTPFYLRTKTTGKPELCHVVNGAASLVIPGGELESLLIGLVTGQKLPLSPRSENTMIGVWIDTPTAYRLKKIRTKGWMVETKGFVSKSRNYCVADLRSYYLWHLDATNNRSREQHPDLLLTHYQTYLSGKKGKSKWDPTPHIERSKVPTLSHKYTRKWVHWYPPVTATPVHLYWWTEVLTRNYAG